MPGPGSYNHSRPQSSGPKWQFGNDKKKSIYKDQENPGPGAYSTLPPYDFNAGYTLISRKPDNSLLEPSKVPGPGSYNHLQTTKPTVPSYKIGTGNRLNVDKDEDLNPGPGSYQATDFTRPNTAKCKFILEY